MYSEDAMRRLVRAAEKSKWNSKEIGHALSHAPEILLSLLSYYLLENHPKREKSYLKFIAICFEHLRDGLDEGSAKAQALLSGVEVILSSLNAEKASSKLAPLYHLIHKSQLPLEIESFTPKAPTQAEIRPNLPEYLEKLATQYSIASSFDLYEDLMSQLQVMPPETFFFAAKELALTQKELPHEVAVLMLLHPKAKIRQEVMTVLIKCVPPTVFTPVDLRRLLVIRNWVPAEEQMPLDYLIKSIRLQGIAPAAYTSSVHSMQILASAFDGTGAQLIAFSAKQANKRMMGGFIVKHEVGIRDVWLVLKPGRKQLKDLFKGNELSFKTVNLAYVNKAVRHFLAEGQKKGHTPPPMLLRLSEILGISEWQPILLDKAAEFRHLSHHLNPKEVKQSLKRRAHWCDKEPFFKYWLESHERVTALVAKALQHPPHDLEKWLIQQIFQTTLEKWKTIILFMGLWASSEVVQSPLWVDLVILFKELESDTIQLTDIPLMRKIAQQSVSAILSTQ